MTQAHEFKSLNFPKIQHFKPI